MFFFFGDAGFEEHGLRPGILHGESSPGFPRLVSAVG